MGKFIDIAGQKFGYLTAVRYLGQTKWQCKCRCGKLVVVEGGHLRSRHSTSCGCYHLEILSADGGTSGKKLVGKRFERLEVVEYLGDSRYRCICDCGTEHTTKAQYLRGGDTKSCGCLKDEIGDRLRHDLTGKIFGRLTVLKHIEGASWLCECSCSRQIHALASNLVGQKTTSCGCLKAEYARLPRKHGFANSPTYYTWNHMLQRCNNPRNTSYRDYGGRGIRVCKRWNDFEKFLADMGEKPEDKSLDRIDCNKGYSKQNCRWASVAQQANNKRNTVMIEFQSETKSLSEWSIALKIPRTTLYERIYRLGWSVERAFKTGSVRASSKSRLTHGLSLTKAYRAWSGAKSRCSNPRVKSYALYGGRGIKMSEEWQADFSNFLADMGHPPTKEHSLDRINPDGDYCAENCRWALSTEQANNRRVVPSISINGSERTLAEWAELTGIPRQTLGWRLKNGWPAEDAITIQVGAFHKKPHKQQALHL